MNSIIVDTDILIDHLRGVEAATFFLERIARGEYQAMVSVITELELFAGTMKNGEAQKVLNLLSMMSTIPVGSETARKAGEILRQHRNTGLSALDAIIAASALLNNAVLVTRNVKHFRPVEGLLVLNPLLNA